MKLLITGGAGFIGSAVIRHLIANTQDSVVNIDKLTYAGNIESVAEVSANERYEFEHVDICDRSTMKRVFFAHQPDAVMRLAAESHFDRSIDAPTAFIDTNIVGTYTLLEVARLYFESLKDARKADFRFLHVSTDEVFGDMEDSEKLFTETTAYAPSSPYAASKAGADHLVRAWLYVEDHARALLAVVNEGQPGETYNIGGHNESRNIDVVHALCDLLEELALQKPAGVVHYRDLIVFVEGRPGHDLRYAIDASKIQSELGWSPVETFESEIRKTVEWYLENREWCRRVQNGSYQRQRIGLSRKETA